MMSSLPKLNPYSMNLKKKKITAVISCGHTSSIAMGKLAVREERKPRSFRPVFTSTLSSSFLKSEQAGGLLLGMMRFPQVWGQWGSWYSRPSLPGKRRGLWLLRHQPNSSKAVSLWALPLPGTQGGFAPVSSFFVGACQAGEPGCLSIARDQQSPET